MNKMQRLIVEKVFHSLGNTPKFNIDRIEDQLLFYIHGESGVGKSRVIHAIELGCNLLLRDSNLVITAPTGAIADNIGGSTIHTSLAIGIRNRHRKSNILSSLRTARCIMIMDELSIVEMEMLSNMGKLLAKARGLSNSSIAMFGGLPIVIVMEDFYQFLPIAEQPLWGEPQTDEDHNGKTLWLFFSSVITLTQQMHQQNNPNFTQFLRRACMGELTHGNVAMLNGKVVTALTLNDLLKNIVIVQRNKTKHLINCFQIERFAQSVDHDIIIFPAQHNRIKREGRENVYHKDLFFI